RSRNCTSNQAARIGSPLRYWSSWRRAANGLRIGSPRRSNKKQRLAGFNSREPFLAELLFVFFGNLSVSLAKRNALLDDQRVRFRLAARQLHRRYRLVHFIESQMFASELAIDR